MKLHDSLTISEVPIEKSDETNDNSVWGVVTWTMSIRGSTTSSCMSRG